MQLSCQESTVSALGHELIRDKLEEYERPETAALETFMEISGMTIPGRKASVSRYLY